MQRNKQDKRQIDFSFSFDDYEKLLRSRPSDQDYEALRKEAGLDQQSRLSDKQIYLGSMLYLLALNTIDDVNREKYLEMAALEYGSFHATLYQLDAVFQKIEGMVSVDLDLFLEITCKVLDYISVLEFHLSPGFILMSHAYLWLNKLYLKLQFTDRSACPVFPMDFLYNAMLSIYLAHVLHDDSKPEIFNAYGPQGLQSSNVFKTSDTKEMVGYVFRLFSEARSSSVGLMHFENAAQLYLRRCLL